MIVHEPSGGVVVVVVVVVVADASSMILTTTPPLASSVGGVSKKGTPDKTSFRLGDPEGGGLGVKDLAQIRDELWRGQIELVEQHHVPFSDGGEQRALLIHETHAATFRLWHEPSDQHVHCRHTQQQRVNDSS